MSKETKVGLVVGLGFIVMFAVILSKKAGTVPYAELERDIAVGGEGTVQIVESANPPPAPERETTPSAPEQENRIVRSLPQRNDVAPEQPGTDSFNTPAPSAEVAQRPEYPGLAPRDLSRDGIKLPKVMASQESSHQNATVTEASPSASPEPATVVKTPSSLSNSPATPTARPAPATPAESLIQDLEEIKEERLAGPSKPEPKRESQPTETPELTQPKPAPPEPSPLNDRKIKTKQYIAKAKDTLYKIAVMHYGSKHPDGVQHIFEANKGKLKSIDKLRIGQKLVIPEWEGATGDDGFAATDLGAMIDEIPAVPITLAAEKPKSPAPASALKKVDPQNNPIAPEEEFVIYEIQPNDSLTKIAERELGTMHLWKELHRANRDKVPTPEKLRVGAKIRIPLDLIVQNGEGDDEEE